MDNIVEFIFLGFEHLIESTGYSNVRNINKVDFSFPCWMKGKKGLGFGW